MIDICKICDKLYVGSDPCTCWKDVGCSKCAEIQKKCGKRITELEDKLRKYTEITPIYLETHAIPIFRSPQNHIKWAGDNYGDIECPFCDNVVCNEKETIRLGDKCKCCNAELVAIRILKREASDE